MNNYKITITETLSKTIIVEAEDKYDALDKVNDAVEAEIIVLTADDYNQGSREISAGGKAKGHDFYVYDSLEDFDGYDELMGDYIQW